MSLQLKLTGDGEALANLRKVAAAVGDERMREFGLAALEPVAESARSLAPMRSGETASGITTSATLPDAGEAEFNGKAVFVGVLDGDAWWAIFPELGTVKMRAQPFLLPAWDAEQNQVIQILGDLTGRALVTAV